jgi:medium-chain acyl-[acyl-carrier-protein] hydrolase
MSASTAVKSCVIYPKPNPQSRMRLFCFPYAGGTATVFRNWPQYLPSEIEVCAIQYAGRGSRLTEPLGEDVVEVMNGVYQDLQPFLKKPFAFFGHSMGALVSYELARRLQQEGEPEPFQLFVSGSCAPHVKFVDEPTYNLPEPEFIAELIPIRAFGGLKDEMVPREKVEAWSEHTRGSFRAQMLPGDHFFLNTSQSLLTRIVAQELIMHLNKGTGRVQHA